MINNVTSTVLEALHSVAYRTEVLEKTGKFTNLILGWLGNAIKNEAVKSSISLVTKDIKVTTGFLGAFNFFVQIDLWTNGTATEEGYITHFCRNGPSVKLAGKAFLFLGKGLEFTQFLNYWDIIDLGKWGASAVGSIPVLGTIKDTLMLGSTICSITKTVPDLLNFVGYQPTGANIYTPQYKVNHWKGLNEFTVRQACQDKLVRQKVQASASKLAFWQQCDAQVTAGNGFQALKDIQTYKIAKWETRQSNDSNKYRKAFLSAINDLVKLICIPLSITLAVFSVAFLSPFVVAIGAAATTVAFAKVIQDVIGKEKTVTIK